jgi:hypothetical protein
MRASPVVKKIPEIRESRRMKRSKMRVLKRLESPEYQNVLFNTLKTELPERMPPAESQY